MINKKKILAIIPARGGSKSIKKKNLVKINKIPLIKYTINAALNSNYLDEIVVLRKDASQYYGKEFLVSYENSEKFALQPDDKIFVYHFKNHS